MTRDYRLDALETLDDCYSQIVAYAAEIGEDSAAAGRLIEAALVAIETAEQILRDTYPCATTMRARLAALNGQSTQERHLRAAVEAAEGRDA